MNLNIINRCTLLKKEKKNCKGRSKTNKTANVLPLMSFTEMHPGEGVWPVCGNLGPSKQEGCLYFLTLERRVRNRRVTD